VIALALTLGVAAVPATLFAACSTPAQDVADAGHPHLDASFDLGRGDGPYHPEASCLVTIESPPLVTACHVADLDADFYDVGCPGAPGVGWDSNPPSSGPHYPVWAAYQAYTTPVPRPFYVHDEEHGAIVFLYNCADAGDAGCAATAAGLQAAADAIPDDPLCTSAGEGIRVRTVITPDPLIDVPVAAAAWGWTYKAQCVDLPTLEAFANGRYAMGPEDFCSNGTTQF
jgi:hypothetical protein